MRPSIAACPLIAWLVFLCRVGETWMLVATDLIGRGMDFLGINTVVNFDCPRVSRLPWPHSNGMGMTVLLITDWTACSA